MSAAAYRPLARVSTREKGGIRPISALRFEPTASAAKRMADHRLIYRTREGGFQLYARHGGPEGDPLVPIKAPLRLLFAIRSSDPGFHGRFKPVVGEAAAPNLYLTNQADDGEPRAGDALSRGEAVAKEDMARIMPRRLRARIPLAAAGGPSKLEVRRRFTGEAVGEAIDIDTPAEAGFAEIAVDLSGEEACAFTLKPLPSGAAQQIVADDELLGAMGVLELVLKAFPGPAPAGGREYTATFEPREA